MKNIKDLNLHEILEVVKGFSFERFRADQIIHWLYKSNVSSFSEMTNLPKELRELLKKEFYIGGPKIVSEIEDPFDETHKFIFLLEDGNVIETVLIKEEKKLTLCISTQCGCPLGCKFCATALMGFVRNLTLSEITEQFNIVRRITYKRFSRPITNIVFMGMGEPLLNYQNTISAIRIITDPKAYQFSARRITLSTAGIADLIPKVGKDTKVNLAVSINAPTDTKRSELMPINKKYPLHTLLSACKDFPLPKRKRITFEYVLIKDINDSDEDAKLLSELLSDIRCKINLIPLNEHPNISFKRPSEKRIEAFLKVLVNHGYTVTVRRSRGKSIMAACGQLAASYKESNFHI